MTVVANDPEAFAQAQKETLIKIGYSEEAAEARRLEILADTVRPGEVGDPQRKESS